MPELTDGCVKPAGGQGVNQLLPVWLGPFHRR